MDRSSMLAKFLAYIYYNEGGYKDYYVGVISDPSILKRNDYMFTGSITYKVAEAQNKDVARDVIRYLVKLGCSVGPYYNKADTYFVYVALKKAEVTMLGS